jgi:hypothetical protein
MSTFSALRDLPSYLILPFTLLHKGEMFEVGALSEQHSMEFQTPVRVVRGHANKLSYTGKLYTYDGIYQVRVLPFHILQLLSSFLREIGVGCFVN